MNASRILKFISPIFFISMILFSNSCSKKPEYQQVGETFIETYYVKIDPKGALAYTQGPALEKLHQELQRLAGMAPPLPSETSKITYKILGCQMFPPDSAQCQYQLMVEITPPREVLGEMTLRKTSDKWFVTQFAE